MASITKHKSGWRASVARKGIRRSKVFTTKSEARDWAAREEYLILNTDSAVSSRLSFSDVLDRYGREVSSKKRGVRWEINRIERMRKGALGLKPIGDLRPTDFAAWRDMRLRDVSPGTVRREMVSTLR